MKRFLLIVVVLLLLTGCYRKGSVGAEKAFDIAEITRVAIPHGGALDYASDKVELLEMDNYGRRLFLHKKWNPGLQILIVCQQTEEPLTYYYPDYCYLVHPGNETFTEADKDWLKEVNDWNKPLDEEKMRSVNYVDGDIDIGNHVAGKGNTDAEMRKLLDIGNEDIYIFLDGLERDAMGNQLVYASIHHADDVKSEVYLLLCQYLDGECTILNYAQIETGYDCRESIIAFKKDYFS